MEVGRRRGFAGVGVALAAALAAAGEGGVADESWCEGPARYLLTRSEHRRCRRIDDPAARWGFIEQFWERRDPDPATPRNEAREAFEHRCRLADERFGERVLDGWQTDRGRSLILMGPPDRLRRDRDGPRGRDREIWIYRESPDSARTVELVFHRRPDGRFRLDPDPGGTSLPDTAAYEQSRQALRREIMIALRPPHTAEADRLVELLLPEPGLDSMERWPESPARELDPGAGAYSETPVAGPGAGFHEEAYFFRAADGSVLTVVALDLGTTPHGNEAGAAAADPVAAVAWVFDEWADARPSGRKAVVTVPLARRQAGGTVPDGLFTGRVYLEPGSYEVRYAVGRRGQDRFDVRFRTLEVPDLGGRRLSASSVVPADHFGPAGPGGESPFAVGSEEVVPRPGATFRRAETLRLYLQVYGAVPDPVSGRPRVDVRFRFKRANARGGFKRAGKPLSIREADGASMGLALPVGDWKPGVYRVVVDLRDRVTGERVSTEGRFRIAD